VGEEGGMVQHGAGKIVVRDYDPAWPAMFEDEKARLLQALGPTAVAIEHVGSTAVPGLAAKPIIDVLIGVHGLAEAGPRCVRPLEGLGYTYIPEYEAWLSHEMFFRKGIPGPWTHHVHLMESTHPYWQGYLMVREYLRSHHDIANAYGNLKRALAVVFDDDFDGYREAKRPFFEAVMARVREDRQQRPSAG
jgi:GrpB-like predicted nucleotidyltransferase (UPF0157 family)